MIIRDNWLVYFEEKLASDTALRGRDVSSGRTVPSQFPGVKATLVYFDVPISH